MNKVEVFRDYFVNRRVANGRMLGCNGRRILRIEPTYNWNNADPEHQSPVRIQVREYRTSRWEHDVMGEALPDGQIWIDWEKVENFITYRMARKLKALMHTMCDVRSGDGYGMTLYRRKPCKLLSSRFVGSNVSLGASFQNRLLERFGAV